MWACSELAKTCVIYECCLGNEETHAHDFDDVLKDAYDYAEMFSIPEKCREQYSAQELEFLEKLIQRGLKDRKKDTGRKRHVIEEGDG